MRKTWGWIGALSLAGFAIIALLLYAAPDLLAAIDTRASALSPTGFGVISFFLAATALGGGVGIIGVAILFAYLARLSAPDVFRFSALLAAAAFANKVLKELFGRTRPEPLQWFDVLVSFSFPSAHATVAVALYGFIAVVVYRRTKSVWLTLIPVFVALLVGKSRIILGAHHASDVIGGYLLGLALLSMALLFPFERFVRAK